MSERVRGEVRDEMLRHAQVIVSKNSIANKYDAAAHALAKSVLQVFSPISDDSEPITAEWLASVGFGSETLNGWSALLDCESGSVVEMWINHDGEIALGQDDDLIAMTCTPHIRTRGDLRRLWLALTGRELDERKAGE